MNPIKQWRTEGKISNRFVTFHPHSYGIATLMRFAIKLPGGYKVMLHHFRPHKEDSFHDHPWSFRTLVLWGSYTDQSLKSNDEIVTDVLKPGSTRYRRDLHAHRTSCEGHVWTLVFAYPESREWCKGVPERWVCGGEIADFDATRGMVKVHDA